MYIDPMTIYREYVQNAADSIDEARKAGVLTLQTQGKVELKIDAQERSIAICDNGMGIPSATFESTLTAFGGSAKRGRRPEVFEASAVLPVLDIAKNLSSGRELPASLVLTN